MKKPTDNRMIDNNQTENRHASQKRKKMTTRKGGRTVEPNKNITEKEGQK